MSIVNVPEYEVAALGAKVMTNPEETPGGRLSGVAAGCDRRKPAPAIVMVEIVSCCELWLSKTKEHGAVWLATMFPKLNAPEEPGPLQL